jgi:hypothetical protein
VTGIGQRGVGWLTEQQAAHLPSKGQCKESITKWRRSIAKGFLGFLGKKKKKKILNQ